MASSRNMDNSQRRIVASCSSTSSTSRVGKEDDMEEKKLVIPNGYRFHPKDDELLSFYLLNKILGIELPANFIQDIDLYHYHYHPHQIPSGGVYFKNNHSYIFTRLNKETPSRRTTRQGHWEATGEEEKVFAGNKIIGFKKKFLFWENSRRHNKGYWILCEYRMNPDIIPYNKLNDEIISSEVESWVACKIKYKEEGGVLLLESTLEEHEDEGDDRTDEDTDEDEEGEDEDEDEGDDQTDEDKTQNFVWEHKCSGRNSIEEECMEINPIYRTYKTRMLRHWISKTD